MGTVSPSISNTKTKLWRAGKRQEVRLPQIRAHAKQDDGKKSDRKVSIHNPMVAPCFPESMHDIDFSACDNPSTTTTYHRAREWPGSGLHSIAETVPNKGCAYLMVTEDELVIHRPLCLLIYTRRHCEVSTFSAYMP